MNDKWTVIIVLAVVAIAVIAGIATTRLVRTDTSGTWYRVADDAELVPVDSGVSYLYVEDTSAGVVERIEPTPGDFVSSIRKTDVWYRSDKNGNLCHTYISWDADLELGDHMTLSVKYKYQVDMDSRDGLAPTFLVDREVLDFQITKGQ